MAATSIVAAIGAALLLGTGATTASSDDRRNNLDAASAVPARLALAAQWMAADAGDPSPTRAEYVLTTRAKANRVDNGESVNLPDQPVYYVVMHGNFVAKNAYVPPGRPAPRGTIVGFTVDAETYDVLDFSISDKPARSRRPRSREPPVAPATRLSP